MKYDPYSRKRKYLLLAGRLMMILALWFAGTYVFQALNHVSVQADGPISVWWPTQNAKVSGLQPFKAVVTGKNLNEYDMTWSVDGGQQNGMSDSMAEGPHKEASVDLTNWNWRGSGPYKVTFKAIGKDGSVIGETSIDIFGPGEQQGPRETVAGTSTPAIDPNIPSTSNIIISGLTQGGIPSANAQIDSATYTAPVQSTPAPAVQSNEPKFLSVIFPATNSNVNGVNAFRAAVKDMDVKEYTMYWQVDGGQKNDMYTSSSNGTPVKEASVDVRSWTWKGNGPYKITFTAEKNYQTIATSEVTIYTGTGNTNNSNNSSQQASQTVKPETQNPVLVTPETKPSVTQKTQEKVQEVTQAVAGNPLSGLKFYVNPNSNAKRQADAWRQSRPNDAFQMDKIATSPEAIWLGGWNGDVQSDVANKMRDAKAQGAVPAFIVYNIPNRDCGQYSAGGVSDGNSYRSWIQKIAAGLGGSKAIVVLEPDALTLMDCLNGQQKNDRFTMISDAVTTLKNAGAVVYLDAGHSSWVGADDMASRLNSAGIAKADGFALNVSNFQTTQSNIDFGTKVSAKVGGKHFIVDTARNGVGPTPDNQWCNPQGRALGARATSNTGNALVDAFLWLKNPGESDGNCNGGPSAGVWWPEYALELAKRSAF
jgi:endoglucanase